MPKLTIDGREVHVEPGSTVLDAAQLLGIEIPTLCYRSGCDANTSCLACVVRVNGSPRLLPSCATKAAEGMAVESETEPIREARRTALELLLADHAGDCLAPCTTTCPAHMDIPQMIRQIQDGHLRDALITVKENIALPAVLGRICPELCEKGCRRGLKDTAVSICRLKQHVADVDLASGDPYLPPKREASGKRVAIVGAGPTGLSAAWYLLQLGHEAVLLDDHPKPGGNLQYAIDEKLLPRDVLDAEIAVIAKLGAEFRTGVRVGENVALADLANEFDAVLLAVGELDAAKAAKLSVPMAGRGLKADKHTMMTPLRGVFAAGAAVTPFRFAIRAAAAGRAAASVIDGYLRGSMVEAPHAEFTIRLGVLSEQEAATFTAGSPDTPRATTERSVGFSVETAQDEAERCLHCDCYKVGNCALRHWSDIYGADPARFKMQRKPFERVDTHPDVVYEPGKCIACGLCVQVAEKAREPLGLSHIGRGFQVKIGVPLDGELSEALKKVGQEAADACPTAALAMKIKHEGPIPFERPKGEGQG